MTVDEPSSRSPDSFLKQCIDWAKLCQNPSFNKLSLQLLSIQSLPAHLCSLQLWYSDFLPLTTWEVICNLVLLKSLHLSLGNMKQSQDDWNSPREFKLQDLRHLALHARQDGASRANFITLFEFILPVCNNLTSLLFIS